MYLNILEHDCIICPQPVQASCVQTDHEAVCRAGNQEEGKGSKGNARKVNSQPVLFLFGFLVNKTAKVLTTRLF